MSKIAADTSLVFSRRCRSGCHANKVTLPSIAAINKAHMAQLSSFNLMMDPSKSNFIHLCHHAGMTCATAYPGHQNSAHVYAFPVSPSIDTTVLMCSKCLTSNLGLTGVRWKALYPNPNPVSNLSNHDVANLSNATIIQKLKTIQSYLTSPWYTGNVAMVLEEEELCLFQHTIVLQTPQYIPYPTCGESKDGIMSYGTNIIVDGEKITVKNGGNFVVDLSSTNSQFTQTNNASVPAILIAVRKDDLERCIYHSNGKLKFEFVPPNTKGCKSCTQYVILSVNTTMEDNESHYHPEDGDSELFHTHKKSIVKEGQHFGSVGNYYASGIHASYEQDVNGIPKSISSYSTKNKHLPTYPAFEIKMNKIVEYIVSCNNQINKICNKNLVESSATITAKNCTIGAMLHTTMQALSELQTDLTPLSHDGVSAVFPSVNVCCNASTKIYHTENDQGYTLIAAPYQMSQARASFLFFLSNDSTIQVTLRNNSILLFNARLVTHRQETVVCELSGPFWNIGCYANRKFEHHTKKMLRRKYELVLGQLEKHI